MKVNVAKLATASARLKDLVVAEVSGVDKAANLRNFLVIKSADGGKTAKADGDPAAASSPLTISPESKQSLTDALNAAMDKLSAMATVVGEANIQEGAEPPPELIAMVSSAAEDLESCAAQFMPAPAPPAADPTAAPAQNAAPPAPATPPPPAPSADDEMATKIAAAVDAAFAKRDAAAAAKSEAEKAAASVEKRLAQAEEKAASAELIAKAAALQVAAKNLNKPNEEPASNAAPPAAIDVPAAKAWPNDLAKEVTDAKKAARKEARAGR